MINKINCYRYYSDFSGFDIIFTVEDGDFEVAGKLIEEAAGIWFDGEGDVYYYTFSDYIVEYLNDNGITIDVYNILSEEE